MRKLLAGALSVVALSCGSSQPPPSRAAAPPSSLPKATPPPPLPAESTPLGKLPTDVRPLHEVIALDVDPATDRFTGTAQIDLELDHARDVLWLHGRGLAVTSTVVEISSGDRLSATWTQVDPSGVVRVALPRAIGPGKATLRVAFGASYDPSLVGVYRVPGKHDAGASAVFSKFEAIYARRAFPCFDEPSFKVPFDVMLTIPLADVAVGNMPIERSSNVSPGWKQVRFATTPPLPTYLVAFAVGPFDSRASTIAPSELRAAPLPLGAIAMMGRGDETAYALAQAPALVAEEERYFGVAFPYPKLDLVAVPDFQSGAMENAGAITFRDSLLLVDEKTATLGQRISVASVIAHEVAHQWFGDLVTMPWWNDLWLNEGFASFMATRTLRTVKPELEPDLSRVDSTDDVMNTDALASARRVRQPIESTNDITNAFDGITYQKGEAVLTMLEHTLGEETFRRGVHRFLSAHLLKNATTDDLVAALSAEAGRDIGPLASTFLDQPGVPLVAAKVTCDGGKGHVALEQSQWRAVGSSGADETWKIPVCIRAGFGDRVEEQCTELDAHAGSLELSSCPDWVMPNAEASGYYRFTLAGDDLAHLRTLGTKHLSTAERLAFAENLDAAFRSASLPAADVLRALAVLSKDGHGAVATAPIDLYSYVLDFALDDTLRSAMREYIDQLYAPTVKSLGWASSPAEKPWQRLLRSRLLAFLALGTEDKSTLDAAAKLGRAYLGIGGDGKLHPEAVDADLAGIALSAAARKGDAKFFDALLQRLAESQDAPLRRRLLGAMANVRDPALVQRALDIALDPQLRANERLFTLASLLDAVPTRDVAWAWLKAHFDALAPLLPDRFGGALPGIPRFCDAEHADDLRAFFTPRVEKLTGGPRNLAQALERTEQCRLRAAAQAASARQFVIALGALR